MHVSTRGWAKNQPRINIDFSTRDVDSGQTVEPRSNVTICDVEKCIDLHHSRAIPILGAVRGFPPVPSPVHVGALAMARSNGGKAKAFFRANPSGAFDQYLQDIQKLPLIKDPAEERRLARRVQRGDEKAAERLVTANLRFVISYVKKYQGHGLDLSELVAIGNEGLLKAVKKFDPDQGVKFISYAVWWVRQAVLKALAEQTRSVRIPLNQNSQLIRMSRTETYLSQELGREPTDEEIAMALEETVENVRTARRMTAAELSLDAPVDRSDKDAATLGERFAGQEGGEIEEKTDGKLMREFIDRIFQKYLTPRERKILYLYYGLEEGSEAMTLEKIGALMGVTRERIRQIRERAFEKLRESPDGRALKGFWRAA
ncbi:MAG TPA: RNA polymerase sigma factor RpoD/SigA [Myxococcales bacterium]|nr:RNA polymerase sigma factor RpoD/SigA [Myxococcales bacterium]